MLETDLNSGLILGRRQVHSATSRQICKFGLEEYFALRFVEGDEIGDTEEETKAQNTVVGTSNSVPFAVKAKIKLGTDVSASDTITKKLHRTVDEWISEILTHVQAHYHHPTLRHRINFEVLKLYDMKK